MHSYTDVGGYSVPVSRTIRLGGIKEDLRLMLVSFLNTANTSAQRRHRAAVSNPNRMSRRPPQCYREAPNRKTPRHWTTVPRVTGAAAGESKYETENGFRADIETALRNGTPIVRAILPTREMLG